MSRILSILGNYFLSRFLSYNFVFPNEIDEDTETLIKRPLPNEEDTLESSIKKNTQITRESKSETVSSKLDEDVLDGSDIKDKAK